MPKGLSIYDNCAVRVQGRYVAQATTVAISFVSADEIIHILGGGTRRTIAVSPSGRLIRIEWSMACPTDDTEDLRFIKRWRDVDQVKIGVDMFGSLVGISTTGYLQDPRIAGRVGGAIEYSISAVCEPTDFAGV